jgi:hypothetical protein
MHVCGPYNCEGGRWLAPTSWVPTCRCMNIHMHAHTYIYLHKSVIWTAYVYMLAYRHTHVYTLFFYMLACLRALPTYTHLCILHAHNYLLTYVPTILSCYVHLHKLRTLVRWIGDWLTDTYLVYVEHDTDSLLKLPRMMAAAVVTLLGGEGNWSLVFVGSWREGATFGCKIAPGDNTLVKWVGDWLSDTYLMYNELDVESMLKLPRMMAAAVVNQFRRWHLCPCCTAYISLGIGEPARQGLGMLHIWWVTS